MATTEGLTLATTATKSGRGGLFVQGGDVQSGLIEVSVGGVVVEMGAAGVESSISGCVGSTPSSGRKVHPAFRIRDKIKMREMARYFIFAIFMVNNIEAQGKVTVKDRVS